MLLLAVTRRKPTKIRSWSKALCLIVSCALLHIRELQRIFFLFSQRMPSKGVATTKAVFSKSPRTSQQMRGLAQNNYRRRLESLQSSIAFLRLMLSHLRLTLEQAWLHSSRRLQRGDKAANQRRTRLEQRCIRLTSLMEIMPLALLTKATQWASSMQDARDRDGSEPPRQKKSYWRIWETDLVYQARLRYPSARSSTGQCSRVVSARFWLKNNRQCTCQIITWKSQWHKVALA